MTAQLTTTHDISIILTAQTQRHTQRLMECRPLATHMPTTAGRALQAASCPPPRKHTQCTTAESRQQKAHNTFHSANNAHHTVHIRTHRPLHTACNTQHRAESTEDGRHTDRLQHIFCSTQSPAHNLKQVPQQKQPRPQQGQRRQSKEDRAKKTEQRTRHTRSRTTHNPASRAEHTANTTEAMILHTRHNLEYYGDSGGRGHKRHQRAHTNQDTTVDAQQRRHHTWCTEARTQGTAHSRQETTHRTQQTEHNRQNNSHSEQQTADTLYTRAHITQNSKHITQHTTHNTREPKEHTHTAQCTAYLTQHTTHSTGHAPEHVTRNTECRTHQRQHTTGVLGNTPHNAATMNTHTKQTAQNRQCKACNNNNTAHKFTETVAGTKSHTNPGTQCRTAQAQKH